MFASLLIMMLSFPRSCWLVWWIDWLILTGWEYLGEGWEGRLSVIDVRSTLLDQLVDLEPVLLFSKSSVNDYDYINHRRHFGVIWRKKNVLNVQSVYPRWWCHGRNKCHDDTNYWSDWSTCSLHYFSILAKRWRRLQWFLDDDGMAWTGQVSRR